MNRSFNLGLPILQKTKISIGIQTSPAMALIMVAKDRGCFDKVGIDVELKEFTAGKFALQAFLGGSIDFAVAGEVPVTLANLQGNRVHVVSQVVEKTITEVRVVAKRDGNLNTPQAYFRAKKRKLATSIGGGPEFFTYSFLKKYGIAPNQVNIVGLKPGDMPAALTSDTVDAVAIFDPMAYIAQRQMGATGIVFADKSIYSELYVLTARPEDLKTRPKTIEMIIRGLVMAQDIIRRDPKGAKAIVAKYTKLEEDVIDGIWQNFVFAPALTRQLTEYMTAEAQWAKGKGDVSASTQIPNFRRDIIFPDILKRVKSDAVKL